MKLIDTKTGKPLKKGDIVTDFRGDKAVLVDWQEPQHEGSTGRVSLRGYTPQASGDHLLDTTDSWVFPSVINAKFV